MSNSPASDLSIDFIALRISSLTNDFFFCGNFSFINYRVFSIGFKNDQLFYLLTISTAIYCLDGEMMPYVRSLAKHSCRDAL
jgi:hypothetical protein